MAWSLPKSQGSFLEGHFLMGFFCIWVKVLEKHLVPLGKSVHGQNTIKDVEKFLVLIVAVL